jgi:hypothetical protein
MSVTGGNERKTKMKRATMVKVHSAQYTILSDIGDGLVGMHRAEA